MANKITNGRALATGVAFSAPLGTTLPTTVAGAIGSLDPAFKDLGKLNSDGIKMFIDQESISLEDMNGEDVFDIVTSHKVRFELTPMELLNADAAKEWAGHDNVTVSGDEITGITIKQHETVQRSYVFVVALAGNKAAAIVVPCASMSKDSIEIGFTSKEGAMPALEYTAFGDDDDVKAHIYIATR